MKAIKVISFIFFLSLLTPSCTSDEPLAKVKYQISGLDSSVAEIKYISALGGTTTITDFNKFADGKDSKTIGINYTPFDTNLKVTVNNTSSNTKHYDLIIYVNGIVKASTPLHALPTAITTAEVNYTVE